MLGQIIAIDRENRREMIEGRRRRRSTIVRRSMLYEYVEDEKGMVYLHDGFLEGLKVFSCDAVCDRGRL